MHQNAEERLELLHTITEIVHIEVDKRMDILPPKSNKSHPRANAPWVSAYVHSLLAFVKRITEKII